MAGNLCQKLKGWKQRVLQKWIEFFIAEKNLSDLLKLIEMPAVLQYLQKPKYHRVVKELILKQNDANTKITSDL